MAAISVYQGGNAPREHVIQTLTQVPPEVEDYFGGYVGIMAQKRCVLHYLATQTELPAKSGNNLVIPTFKRFDATKIPYLQDGITPEGARMERSIMKLAPKQIGHYTEVTDQVILKVQDHTLRHYAEGLGLHLTEVCDKIIAEALDKSLNVGYGSGGVPNAVQNSPGYIQGSDILTATQFLKLNGAHMVSPHSFGSTIFGSTPVDEAYYAFVHVEIENDLFQIPGFQTLAHYGGNAGIQWMPGEIGKFANARFVASTNLPKNTTDHGATADKPHLSNFFLGKHAYFTTRLGGGAAEFIVSKGGFDPLNQRTQLGYKAWYAAAINTEEKWVYKLVTRTRATAP